MAQVPLGFYTDTSVCIGCKACQVACHQWNDLPADLAEQPTESSSGKARPLTGESYDNTGSLSANNWRHVKFIEHFACADSGGNPVLTTSNINRYQQLILRNHNTSSINFGQRHLTSTCTATLLVWSGIIPVRVRGGAKTNDGGGISESSVVSFLAADPPSHTSVALPL